jgi:hypothetical protein
MIRRFAIPLVTVACLAAAQPAAAVIDVNAVAAVDFQGSLDLGAFTPDANPGFTLGLELMFDVPVVELGAGIEYGFPRSVDGGGNVDYWNLYGIARLFVFGKLYLAGRLGYHGASTGDFIDGDLSDNGVSWSAGAGLGILNKLKVELLYSDFGSDLDYQTWSARAVYTF